MLTWLSHAWFDPYRLLIEKVGVPGDGNVDWIAVLNGQAREHDLVNGAGQPIRFIRAEAMPAIAYETTIARTGNVPTRAHGEDAWHDYFNALVWLTFPLTKARLNTLQAQAIDHAATPGRGRLRDMLTLFDESAALFATGDPRRAQALRAFDWQQLFVTGREHWAGAVSVVVFGHALLLKLRQPYKAVCAQAWILDRDRPMGNQEADAACAPRGGESASSLDRWVAGQLFAQSMLPGCLTPLPVLGVPGWWPANSDPQFYEDAGVFRTSRRR